MKYHLKYKNFDKRTINAVKDIIKAGFFKIKTEEDFLRLNEEGCLNLKEYKEMLLNILNLRLSEIYKIEVGLINFEDYNYSCYNHNLNMICLDKPSLISFLHEFKHKLDILKTGITTEDNARGWSISLFYKATPNLCLNSIRKGLILHEKKEDLI